MKVKAEDLIEVLKRKMTQIQELPKTVQKEVEKWMTDKYNVKGGDVVDIFNGRSPLEIQNYDMLYKLTASIHDSLLESQYDRWKELDLSELDVKEYFFESEIEQYKQPIVIQIEDEDIVFTEFFQVNYDHFVAKATIDEIIKWRNLNKIKYNPDTQRDLVFKNSKGITIAQLDINENAVDSMVTLMNNNEFISDSLTLNVNTDINLSSEQLPRVIDKKLIIPKQAIIDIVDGFHRYTAMCRVKDNNRDWDFSCVFNIVVFDTEKANKFILQEDKKNHLSEKQTRRINKNDEANFVIDQINTTSKSYLKGRIDKDLAYDLNVLITELFNPQKRIEESIPLYKLIVKNMNELIDENELYNKDFTKEEWFIYLYCMKKSQELNLEFIDLMSKLDTNELLKQIHYKKKPLPKYYKLIDVEVKNYV